MAGLHVRTHVAFAYTAAGALYGGAAVLLGALRISIDPALEPSYLLAPIAAVVIAGAALSGGLASATSTWVAALALTFLTQMLLILGLSTALQFIVFGAAIIVGMLVSGDRIASLLGRLLRRIESTAGTRPESEGKHELRLARKGGTMEGRQKSAASRMRPVGVGVLALALLGTALMVVSVSSGGTDTKQATAAKPVVISAGKGFGEVYAAKASTLKHTLFKATLLPKDTASRNITLAGLGRADRKVNEALALRCWKSNGCKTGTGGKLTVAYIEQFGENVFRQMSKMEFILQALTYPQVGTIIYRSAHSDLNQGIADFKAAIAQKVSLIVTYPDYGDAMLPVMKQATDAGIPVATYAWGFVDRPRHELPDRRGRGHLRARQDLRVRHEPAGQVR